MVHNTSYIYSTLYFLWPGLGLGRHSGTDGGVASRGDNSSGENGHFSLIRLQTKVSDSADHLGPSILLGGPELETFKGLGTWGCVRGGDTDPEKKKKRKERRKR